MSSRITVQELAAMLGAREVVRVSGRERTMRLRGRDGEDLWVPAPATQVTGVIVAVDDRVVRLKSDRRGSASELTIPRAAIEKVERMAGRRSHLRYAALGALLGSGVGAAAGAASVSCRPHEFFCSTGLGALAGALVGAAGGAVTGAIVPPPVRWDPVDVGSLAAGPFSLDDPPLSTLSFSELGRPLAPEAPGARGRF